MRDLTDPTIVAQGVAPEAGLKEPLFENLEIPEELGPVTVEVDDHRLKRFAFTQDDHHAWHLDDSPFGGRIAQAGLLTNDLVQLFTTRYAASRVVGLHTEEQLWFHQPVRLGTPVTLSGRYTQAYERRGQGYVVMEGEATGPDGEVYIHHCGVEILRTVPGQVAGRGTATTSANARQVSGEYDRTLGYAETAHASLVPGTSLLPLHKQVTQEQASVFSRCGEYVRNIHNDLETARKGGLRIPIVQGQQQACHITELLTRFFGTAWFTHGWIRCKFVQTVEMFEDLSVGGVVTGVTPRGDGHEVDVDVWVRRADGKLSTIGWAQCVVPAK